MSTFQFPDRVIPSYTAGTPTTYSSTLQYSNYATTTGRAPTGYSSTVPFSTYGSTTAQDLHARYPVSTYRYSDRPTAYSSTVPYNTYGTAFQVRHPVAISVGPPSCEGTSVTQRQFEQLRGHNSMQRYNKVVIMDMGSTGSRMRLSDSEVKVMRCLT